MKMQTVFYALALLCFLSTHQSMLPAAQDISQWHLPDGAAARLGKGTINDIAYSPDGKHLAVVSDIGVWLYDALTGTEQALLTKHTGRPVSKVFFSPDGHTLAVTGEQQGVQLWDVRRQTLKGTFDRQTHGHWPIDALFSPDGQTIAIADLGQTTQLWDVSTMNFISTLEGSTDHHLTEEPAIFGIAYSPNGDTIAIGSSDGTVRLWDTSTGTLKHTVIGNIASVGKYPFDSIKGFAFSPDGKTIATRSFANTIWLWNTETGRYKRKIQEGGKNIIYSSNENILAIPAWGGLQLWDTETGKCQNTFVHPGEVKNFAFSPDGKTITTVQEAENKVWTVRWDTATSEKKSMFEHPEAVESTTFSPDGKTVATVSANNMVRVWDTTTGKHKYTLEHTNSIVGVSYARDNPNVLTTVHRDKILWMWNTVRLIGNPAFSLTKHTKDISSTAFSPDGRTLATAGEDRFLHLWDIPTRTFKETLMENSILPGYPLTFNLNGETLIIGKENVVCLLEIASKSLKKIRYNKLIEGATRVFIRNIAYSPDGRTLAIQVEDRIILLDIATEKVTWTLEKRIEGRIEGVAFSPDGKTIAATLSDGKIQLWDIPTQTLKLTITESSGPLLAFSPDGRTIATGGNWTVDLWDTTTGILIKRLAGHAGRVRNVTYNPDGKVLATASRDGTVLLWDLTSHHLNPIRRQN